MAKKKQSLKLNPSSEAEPTGVIVPKELIEIIKDNPSVLIEKATKNGQVRFTITGKFYAKDGFVIGREGQVVSKKMEQHKAEDIAAKFNK